LTDNVLKILYASEEEKVEIDDEGNLTITPAAGAKEKKAAEAEDEMINDEEEKNN
jgi:hypothetical protein